MVFSGEHVVVQMKEERDRKEGPVPDSSPDDVLVILLALPLSPQLVFSFFLLHQTNLCCLPRMEEKRDLAHILSDRVYIHSFLSLLNKFITRFLSRISLESSRDSKKSINFSFPLPVVTLWGEKG